MTSDLLQISCWIHRWRNFENRQTFGKVMNEKYRWSFLTHSVDPCWGLWRLVWAACAEQWIFCVFVLYEAAELAMSTSAWIYTRYTACYCFSRLQRTVSSMCTCPIVTVIFTFAYVVSSSTNLPVLIMLTTRLDSIIANVNACFFGVKIVNIYQEC